MASKVNQAQEVHQGKHGCRFCEEVGCDRPSSPWNSPLFQSPHFVVIPSLGSLISGWLLIVPREHFLSTAVLPPSLIEEMDCLKRAVARVVAQEFAPGWAFEHGPAAHKRAVGCGVDHAHVHVVPLRFDLVEAATPFLPYDVRFRPGTMETCREYILRGYDYLYAESPTGDCVVAGSPRFGSQVFRKAIAHRYRKFKEYRWSNYPQFDNVSVTISRLQSNSLDTSLVGDPAEIVST